MKTILLAILLLIGITSQAQKPINVLSMGFGKDFISGEALINANFMIHNAYASYSISIENSVKSYDVGWAFNQKALKGFYLIPTLGVTVINRNDISRICVETVPNTEVNITVVDGVITTTTFDQPIGSVVGAIDQINSRVEMHPNIGLFAGYQFKDGLTLFIKATNNSLGAGMGFIIN